MGQGNPNWVKGISQNPAGRPKREDTYTRQEIMQVCKARHFNPIHALIDIYENPKSSGYLKKDCAAEIAGYS